MSKKFDDDSHLVYRNNLKVIKPHRKINFGCTSIFPISLTHTVPDAVGYVLYTPDGAIFYTGNFIFDSSMLGAYKTDYFVNPRTLSVNPRNYLSFPELIESYTGSGIGRSIEWHER